MRCSSRGRELEDRILGAVESQVLIPENVADAAERALRLDAHARALCELEAGSQRRPGRSTWSSEAQRLLGSGDGIRT